MRVARAWLVGALAVAAWAGDPDVANLLLQKGRKAFAAKSYEEAAGCFERALEELRPFPEAAFALGETLEKLEKPIDAAAAYRRCREQCESAAAAQAAKWRPLAAKAAKAETRLAGGSGELASLDRDFVKACLDFARRNLKSSPVAARKACETALKVDPGNAPALSLMSEAKFEAPKPAGSGEPLIRGDGLEEWFPGMKEPWSCAGGVITCLTEPKQGKLNWREDIVLEGRYRYSGSFRLADREKDLVFGLFFAGKDGLHKRAGFILDDFDELVLVLDDGAESQTVQSSHVNDCDRSAWHTLRIDVEPGKVACRLDGRLVFEHQGESSGDFDGSPGIFVQGGPAEVKDLQVER